MAIDPAPLLELVAKLADELDVKYGPAARLELGLVIVEILVPDGAADDPLADAGSIIEHRSTSKSSAHALGAVELANDSLRATYERGDD